MTNNHLSWIAVCGFLISVSGCNDTELRGIATPLDDTTFILGRVHGLDALEPGPTFPCGLAGASPTGTVEELACALSHGGDNDALARAQDSLRRHAGGLNECRLASATLGGRLDSLDGLGSEADERRETGTQNRSAREASRHLRLNRAQGT